MQKIFHTVAIILFLHLNSSAQQSFYETFRNNHPSLQDSTFFIISATTLISENTGSSAIINNYNAIRKLSKNMPIYFVLDNAGEVSDITLFFKESYFIDLKNDANLHLIVDDPTLTEQLKFGSLAQVFFIKNAHLIYHKDAKYHCVDKYDLPIATKGYDSLLFPTITPKRDVDVTNLPSQNLSIDLKSKKNTFPKEERYIVLDNNKFSNIDLIKKYKNDYYVLTDNKNNVYKYVSNNQKATELEKPDEEKIYCNQIAKTQDQCDTAKKYKEQILKKINRKSYYIFDFENAPNYVYLNAGIQAFEILNRDMVFYLGDSAFTAAKKGELFGMGYNIISKYDNNLKHIQTFLLSDTMFAKQDLVIDKLYFENDSIFYAFMIPYNKEFYQEDVTQFIAKFKIKEKHIEFLKFMPPTLNDTIRAFIPQFNTNYFTAFNNQIVCASDIDNTIFEVKQAQPIIHLKGTRPLTKPNRKVSGYEDNDEADGYVNFQIKGLASDDQYLYVLYIFEDKEYLIDTYDENYKLVKTQEWHFDELKRIWKVRFGDNILLHQNKLHVKTKVNDKKAKISIYTIE